MEDQDVKRFEKWRKVGLFMNPTEFGDERVVGACLGYMIRLLSKGIMPESQLVIETLEGKRKVPPCGYINCFWDEDDHVH